MLFAKTTAAQGAGAVAPSPSRFALLYTSPLKITRVRYQNQRNITQEITYFAGNAPLFSSAQNLPSDISGGAEDAVL